MICIEHVRHLLKAPRLVAPAGGHTWRVFVHARRKNRKKPRSWRYIRGLDYDKYDGVFRYPVYRRRICVVYVGFYDSYLDWLAFRLSVTNHSTKEKEH